MSASARMVMVPVQLPQGVLQDFVLTHSAGERGQDAWTHLLEVLKAQPRPEEAIVTLEDEHGEPALVFPGTPKTRMSCLLSHMARMIDGHAPALSLAMENAVSQWRVLKQTGQVPPKK